MADRSSNGNIFVLVVRWLFGLFFFHFSEPALNSVACIFIFSNHPLCFVYLESDHLKQLPCKERAEPCGQAVSYFDLVLKFSWVPAYCCSQRLKECCPCPWATAKVQGVAGGSEAFFTRCGLYVWRLLVTSLTVCTNLFCFLCDLHIQCGCLLPFKI